MIHRVKEAFHISYVYLAISGLSDVIKSFLRKANIVLANCSKRSSYVAQLICCQPVLIEGFQFGFVEGENVAIFVGRITNRSMLIITFKWSR